MDVKRGKPRKGRGPSPTLWEMTQRVTDDEWRQLKAFSQVYGKGSQQFQLLELLRSMAVYDSRLEKETFAECALGVLRHNAKAWMIRTVQRLAFYATEVMEQTLDVDVLLRWGMHEEALKFITEAKKLAIEQEEFGWVAMLLRQEMIAIKSSSIDLEQQQLLLELLAQEAVGNANLLALEKEIEAHEIRFIDRARKELVKEGKFDEQLQSTYFETILFKTPCDQWPVSLQIKKLRIDEFTYYIFEKTEQAIQVAIKILDLLDRNLSIRRKMIEEHAKCLFRLNQYYADTGNTEYNRRVIAIMRGLAPDASTERRAYLTFFLFMLLQSGFEQLDESLIKEGVHLWEKNAEYLQYSLQGTAKVETLLHICAYYVSWGNFANARQLIKELQRVGDISPHPPYQAVWRILHLIFLIEDNDDRGLESYGTNYKRHLKKILPKPSAAAIIVSLLSRPGNADGLETVIPVLKAILETLSSLEPKDQNSLKPFSYPLMKWAERKLLAKTR